MVTGAVPIQMRVSQTNPAVAREMSTSRVIFILCLSLSMVKPTMVAREHWPSTAKRPIMPISWSSMPRGRKLFTITAKKEPRIP